MGTHTCSLSAWEAEKDHTFKVSLGCVTRYKFNNKKKKIQYSYRDIVFVQGLSLYAFEALNHHLSSSAERERSWHYKAIGRGLALAASQLCLVSQTSLLRVQNMNETSDCHHVRNPSEPGSGGSHF